MIAKHLVITGRVQGVGYRDWMVARAQAMGLSGWVRNLPNGAVEALVAGPTPAVEEMLRQCRRGPRMASVSSITEELVDPPAEMGFRRVG